MFRFTAAIFPSALLVLLTPAALAATDKADTSVLLAPVTIGAIQTTGTTSASQQQPLGDATPNITRIDQQTLANDNIRQVQQLSREDTSVQANYAPVGYYQNVAIRGFALDLASGYRVNNHTVVGEQLFAPEDKEQVEILKGLAGINAGVMAPGGVINYQTKRPEEVRRATLAIDERGSHYQALDVGHWVTNNVGLRINIARDSEQSYVPHTNGHREFYSLAADWLITPNDTLQFDSSYQTSSQRSASGYQLLGGKDLPHANPRHNLGYQSWQQPVGIRTTNNQLRWLHDFNDSWQLQLSGSHSQSVIDDYSAFAYGCADWSGCSDGSTPERFFGADGDYDIYDFRSPDDRRRNQEARLQLDGDVDIAGFRHQLSVGVEWQRRQVDSRPWVFDYVGTTQLGQTPPTFIPSTNHAGKRINRLDHRESSAFIQERWHLNHQWQLLAGTRFVHLNENVHGIDGGSQRQDSKNYTLPTMAVIWQPNANLNTYASYSKGLALGLEAPFWTSNEGDILKPRKSRQIELGLTYQWQQAIRFQAALFQLRQENQFGQPDNTPAGFTLVQQGHQEHYGLELGASGHVTDNLELRSGITLTRARLKHTGTSAYEGHQSINVPPVRARLALDYALPVLSDFHLTAGWQFAAKNPATDDGHTKAPSYQLVDAGFRYRQHIGKQQLTWRLHIDNLLNTFYWRDTGAYLGDNYLFAGAPRTARLSMAWDW